MHSIFLRGEKLKERLWSGKHLHSILDRRIWDPNNIDNWKTNNFVVMLYYPPPPLFFFSLLLVLEDLWQIIGSMDS